MKTCGEWLNLSGNGQLPPLSRHLIRNLKGTILILSAEAVLSASLSRAPVTLILCVFQDNGQVLKEDGTILLKKEAITLYYSK